MRDFKVSYKPRRYCTCSWWFWRFTFTAYHMPSGGYEVRKGVRVLGWEFSYKASEGEVLRQGARK